MEKVSLTRAKTLGQWLRIWWLYKEAFPMSERKPFTVIYKMARHGKADVWVIRCDGEFSGFGATINGSGLVLLDYFAVKKTLRGKGIGTAALRGLMQRYHDRGVFVEIEGTWEDGADKTEREKRKCFYQNAGMEELHVRAEVFGVNMELLGVRCSLDFDQYQAFYWEHYNSWTAEHILPIQ